MSSILVIGGKSNDGGSARAVLKEQGYWRGFKPHQIKVKLETYMSYSYHHGDM